MDSTIEKVARVPAAAPMHHLPSSMTTAAPSIVASHRPPPSVAPSSRHTTFAPTATIVPIEARRDSESEDSTDTDGSQDDNEVCDAVCDEAGSPSGDHNASTAFELQTSEPSRFDAARRYISKKLVPLRRGWAAMWRAPKSRDCFEADSMYIMSPKNPFRIFVFNVIHHKVFEGFIIAVILLNCVTLAMDDPTTDVSPPYQTILSRCFMAIFTLEMSLKMIAFGVALHDGAYFRSSWNALDFTIVCLSYLDLIPSFGNFTAFRTLRVLRPLRSMNAIPQLKTIATCLVHSVKGLANVFVLGVFIYFVFSILAVQLWMGNLRYRCVVDYDSSVTDQMCNPSANGNPVNGYMCPDGLSCLAVGNPNNGYTSLDSVPWAILVVFQTITLEGWSTLMYLSMDACGWPAAIFYILVVIIGAYFVLNLCLAVISFHFQNVKERMVLKEIEAARKEEAEILQSEEGLERARSSLRLPSGGVDELLANQETFTLSHKSSVGAHRVIPWKDCIDSLAVADRIHLAMQLEKTAAGSILRVTQSDEFFTIRGTHLHGTREGSELSVSEGRLMTAQLSLSEKAPNYGRWHSAVVMLYRLRRTVFQFVEGDLSTNHLESITKLESEKLQLVGDLDAADALKEQYPEGPITYFGLFIYGCIVANTIVLAAEHYGESDSQNNIAGILNTIFSSIFFAEMVLKLFCLSPYWYFRDSSNLFDCIVTVISLIEIVALQGSSTFSVFRAVRVMRVLRLLKGIPSLKALIEVLAMAVSESMYLFVVLALYFLIASLVGMQFFADQLQTNPIQTDPVISSFVSFPKAFYAVMQILTYDSWPDIMWNAMNATTQGALIYFVGCIFIGNLCVLNLLIAIIIDSFETYAKNNKKADDDDDSDDGNEVKGGGGTVGGALAVAKGVLVHVIPSAVNRTLLPFGAQNILNTQADVNYDAPGDFPFVFGRSQDGKLAQPPSPDNGTGPSDSNNDEQPDEMEEMKIMPTVAESGTDDVSIPESALFGVDEVPQRICAKCGDPIITPFQPISKMIEPISPEELHFRMCDIIQFRKIKEATIKHLISSMLMLDDEDDDDDEGSNPLWSGKHAKRVQRSSPSSFAMNPTTPHHHASSPMAHHTPDQIPTQSVPGYLQGNSGDDSTPSVPYTPDNVLRDVPPPRIILPHQFYGEDEVSETSSMTDDDAHMNQHAVTALGGTNMKGKKFPTSSAIREAFGKAWEVGLLLGEDCEEFVDGKSWRPIKKLLREEYAVLQLKIGEEQIGRALNSYTRANVPPRRTTNGGTSLYLFGPNNWIRLQLTALVSWKPFDYFILGLIVCSSVTLALDNPNNSDSLTFLLDSIGNAFTVLFALECMFKIIALGFFMIDGAYLRNSWNWLDFVVVVISIVSWILESLSSAKIGAFKVLRTLRVLRPLRLVNRNRGLKLVVMTLLSSIKGAVTLILFLVFLIFAILGVQLFGGLLYSCSDASVNDRLNCTGYYDVVTQQLGVLEVNRSYNYTLSNGTAMYGWELANVTAMINVTTNTSRAWINADVHFDDTINAFVSLFRIATLDNWGSTMYRVIAATDSDHGPQDWNNIPRGFFFVAFVFIGALFLMNVFVGLIIENFHSAKAHMDGVGLLTHSQKLWVETQRMMLNFRPQRLRVAGDHKIQKRFAHLAEIPAFEVATSLVVFLNIVVIAMEGRGQSAEFTKALEDLNIVFTALFLAEALIKIVAYDHRYFLDNWNRFDFFIVVLGIFDIVTSGSAIPINVGLLRILRVFRIARILVLVRKARDIRVLLETLWYSIPSLANIGAFMFLMLFVFTVLGVQLFVNVKRDGVGLTEHANFESFGVAFLFLIQVTTLDNWGVTMTSLQVTTDCGPATDPNGVDRCGMKYAPLFFMPFILLSSYVMVNLFCAVILDNFDTTMELDKSELKMSDLKKFTETWASFDPDATLLMETKRFAELLVQLKPPLGVERIFSRKKLLSMSREYEIPEHGGVIHFVETLIPMARKVLRVQLSYEEIREHEQAWKEQFPDILSLPTLRFRQKRCTVDQYLAATYIASAFRRKLARLQVNEMRSAKQRDLEVWYEEHNVPEVDRSALHRLKEEQEVRKKSFAVENQRVYDIIAAGWGDTQSDGGDRVSVDSHDKVPPLLARKPSSMKKVQDPSTLQKKHSSKKTMTTKTSLLASAKGAL